VTDAKAGADAELHAAAAVDQERHHCGTSGEGTDGDLGDGAIALTKARLSVEHQQHGAERIRGA
jgi:hypothetical protein